LAVLQFLRNFLPDRRANVTLIVALSAVPIFLCAAIALDMTNAVRVRTRLQDSTDAASLAASAAVARNPNLTVAQLQAIAADVLAADFAQYPATISEFHVCAPVQSDCSASSGAMRMNTVLLATRAEAPCPMAAMASGTCGHAGATMPVSARNTTVIGMGATIQINLAMDSSASMIVGATPDDVSTIADWVGAHWSQVKPGDPAPFSGKDNPPCAFACHDVGGSTTSADIVTGLTNAHDAGATTRYDVMISAAQQLVNHVQARAADSNLLARYAYVFNVYSFDTSLHQYLTRNLDYAQAQTAIQSVQPGLDTHLSSAMGQMITSIGSNGTGVSVASPLKFLIIVTDGLESDRDANWSGSCSNYDFQWRYPNICTGGFAKTISAAQCARLKNNGVVVGVLETPYVPLTGQSPNIAPYERTVRQLIYPKGPSTASTVSAALQACASTGYYFQATSPSDIASGFISLTDRFIAAQTHLSS
jgi:Flp pilus assembly protein TadG